MVFFEKILNAIVHKRRDAFFPASEKVNHGGMQATTEFPTSVNKNLQQIKPNKTLSLHSSLPILCQMVPCDFFKKPTFGICERVIISHGKKKQIEDETKILNSLISE